MHKNVKLKTSQVLEREGLGEYKYIERPGFRRVVVVLPVNPRLNLLRKGGLFIRPGIA